MYKIALGNRRKHASAWPMDPRGDFRPQTPTIDHQKKFIKSSTGQGVAQGNMYQMAVRLNRPCAAAMRLFVK